MLNIAVTPSTNPVYRGLRANRSVWEQVLVVMPRGESELDRANRRVAALKITQEIGELGEPEEMFTISFHRAVASMILQAAGLAP